VGLTCKNEVSTLTRTKCVSEEAEVMGSGYPRLTFDGSELANKNTTRGELGVRVPPVACWVCPAKLKMFPCIIAEKVPNYNNFY
jgi:hypothetical protein